MANTSTKVNSFIAMGYSFLATQTPVEHESVPSPADMEQSQPYDTSEKENILPINNQVLKTLNLNIQTGGLRI